jgi:hypothetical protein
VYAGIVCHAHAGCANADASEVAGLVFMLSLLQVVCACMLACLVESKQANKHCITGLPLHVVLKHACKIFSAETFGFNAWFVSLL